MTRHALKPLQKLLVDELGSELLYQLVVVAALRQLDILLAHQPDMRAHMPVDLPSASTPPSTSNGVIFCSLSAAAAAAAEVVAAGTSAASGIVGVRGGRAYSLVDRSQRAYTIQSI